MNKPTMNPQAKHTPGPWQISKEMGIGQTIVDADGKLIGYCDAACRDREVNQANAAFIVQACNSHAELLDEMQRTNRLALELMERAAEIDRLLIAKDGREPDCELGEIVRLRQQLAKNNAAIAKAGGAQ